MSDHADNADSRIYRTIAAGLAAARHAPALQPDCRCHFCDEPAADGDGDAGDDQIYS